MRVANARTNRHDPHSVQCRSVYERVNLTDIVQSSSFASLSSLIMPLGAVIESGPSTVEQSNVQVQLLTRIGSCRPILEILPAFRNLHMTRHHCFSITRLTHKLKPNACRSSRIPVRFIVQRSEAAFIVNNSVFVLIYET